MFETYKPSGGFAVLAFPLMAIMCALGVGLAWLYQLAIEAIPLIIINFVITMIFGAILGGMGRLAVKTGHVRNAAIGLVIGLVIGGSAYVAKFWFQYERIYWEQAELVAQKANIPVEDAAEILKENFTFWEHIKFRVENGWTLNKGAEITGIFVYLIWLIEAGIVLGISIVTPSSAAQEPYSEKLGQWADEEKVIMMLPIDNPQMLEQIKTAQSVDELLSIPIPKTDETNQFASYTINSIAGHELEDAYLTVKDVTITLDKDGNEQKAENNLVRYAVLTNEQLAQLNENAELLNEAIQMFQNARMAGPEYNQDPES